jgi:hypothetical protein
LASKIEGNPAGDATSTNREEWIKSAGTLPDVSGFQVQAIWEVFHASKTEKIRNLMDDVHDAFNWFCSNPVHHRTVCAFTVESDWGEFALLSPSAKITAIPGKEIPKDVELSSTKVHWGKGTRDIRDKATFESVNHPPSNGYMLDSRLTLHFDRFYIENDGSSVDIELSHGSDGDGRGAEGSCLAVFEEVICNYNGVWSDLQLTWRVETLPCERH